ncbi:MAG: hypothetical protein QM736_28040 [Vicinamibacterales bacterium]
MPVHRLPPVRQTWRRRLGARIVVLPFRHPRIRLLLRDVDADTDQFFEQRTIGKLLLNELPFASVR